MLDLLIRDGLIIDGTGNPGFYGAVAVENERVVILRGDVESVSTARVIDATDHVVCPGFIDMHAHSGLVILAEPRHEPKVHQGVTTELIGVDSLAFLSIDGLYRAMGEAGRDVLAPRFCDACFTGDYPIPHVDADDGKVAVQLSLLAEPV